VHTDDVPRLKRFPDKREWRRFSVHVHDEHSWIQIQQALKNRQRAGGSPPQFSIPRRTAPRP
jgi:hypothetical protein